MSVLANTICSALVTAAASDFSAGDSGLDMSAAGAVVEGEYLHPPVDSARAFICVSPPSISAAPRHWNLGQWARRLVLNLGVWAPSADDNATRRAAVLALASDVAAALEDTRYSSGGSLTAEDVVFLGVTIDVVDGMEDGMVPGYGHAMLGVEVIYQKARGY